MLKKRFLLLIIIVLIVAYLGGIFSVNFSPFSLTVQKPGKDFLKKIVRKIEGFIYHEATIHNPPGDMLPDQIDDKIKQEIKDRVN
jgi:hypothetical protein